MEKIVIIFNNKDHLELSLALKKALEDLLHCEVIINQKKVYKEQSQYIHIFVDMHHFTKSYIPPKFVVYNYQQLPCQRWHKFECIKDRLPNALDIWDYSFSNMEMTREKLGLSSTFVPFGYSSTFDYTSHFSKRDIDVLFIGARSPRRIQIVDQIKKNGVSISWPKRVDGLEKGKIINRAKIVINLHKFGDLDILEMARISFYLSNKCIVISEKSMDEKLMDQFEDGIIFGNKKDIPDLCKSYLSKGVELDSIREKKYQWFKTHHSYESKIPINIFRQ